MRNDVAVRLLGADEAKERIDQLASDVRLRTLNPAPAVPDLDMM